MTTAGLRALVMSRASRKADHSPVCSCQDCEHAQYALEQVAVRALPALLDVAEAAERVYDDRAYDEAGAVCDVTHERMKALGDALDKLGSK